MDNLPSLADINSICNTKEFEDAKWRYGGGADKEGDWKALLRSERKEHVEEGVRMIKAIYVAVKERRRECLYYSAMGYHKLKLYSDAKAQIDMLARIEPNNHQVKVLKLVIEDTVKVQGAVGLAIVGGLVAVVGVVVASLFKR